MKSFSTLVAVFWLFAAVGGSAHASCDFQLKDFGPLQNQLVNLPESGMDFQIVELELASGKLVKPVYIQGARLLRYAGPESFNEGDILTVTRVFDPNSNVVWP